MSYVNGVVEATGLEPAAHAGYFWKCLFAFPPKLHDMGANRYQEAVGCFHTAILDHAGIRPFRMPSRKRFELTHSILPPGRMASMPILPVNAACRGRLAGKRGGSS